MILGLVALLLTLVWFLQLAPALTRLPNDFEYKVLVFSRDNFYDAERQEFSGEIISNTQHSFQVVDKQDGILLIQDIFKVHQSNGEEIFSVERLYGIDPTTRKHVPGYGDRDRKGYLFAPPNLKKGQNFTYWHINYDQPAYMQFKDEETIEGLTVYRYEADYQADQTFDLDRLVSPLGSQGINLDINLQLWVEPVTGRKIKYEDRTTAYYYNLATRERIHPWNKFHNQYDEISILKQVEIAKHEKLRRFLVERVMTAILALVAILLLCSSVIKKRK